jgi:hypothetical protein
MRFEPASRNADVERNFDQPVFWGSVGLIAALIIVGFPWLQFGQPLSLTGDHLVHLKAIRQAIDGVWRINDKLGAPWHHDNLYFPLFDLAYMAIAKVVSLFTSNIFRVMALTYLVGVSLMFLFAFWAFRALDIPAWLASLAGVVFVASPFFAYRTYQHANLALYFSVPLAAAIPLLLARAQADGGLRKLLRSPIIAVAVLMAGTSGIYYGAFAGIFLTLGSAMVAAERRRLSPLIAGFGISVLIAIILFLTAYGPWLPGFLDGTTPAPPARGGAWAQMYHGMLLSSAMRDYFDLGLWKGNFAEYLERVAAPGLAQTPGEAYFPEWPGAFITTVILASLGLAPILPFIRPRERSASYLVLLMSVLLIAFGVVFALRGGLGYVFNFMITPGIRAQERILPYLQFYALVVICMTWKLLPIKRDWLRPCLAAVLVICFIPGMKAAYQVLPRKQQQAIGDPAVLANYHSVFAMRAAKDAAGLKTILQFPVVFWPESPNVVSFVPYEHLLPYLLDRRGAVTRWSYGLHWNQSGFQELRTVMKVDNPDLVARARALGYDGILIEKAGLTTADRDVLERTVRASGAEALFDDGKRTLLRLPPGS